MSLRATLTANSFTDLMSILLASRPKTSPGLRDLHKQRLSTSSAHQSLPSSPQVERHERQSRLPRSNALKASKIPLKRGSSLEDKMKSIEKKVDQIQKHLESKNTNFLNKIYDPQQNRFI